MTKRINPYLFRLGYHFYWKNSWPILYKDESNFIFFSYVIRNFLENKLRSFEINSLNLFFYSKSKLNILIITNSPSIFFKNKMEVLNKLKLDFKRFLQIKKIKLICSFSVIKDKFNFINPYYIATHIANNLQTLKKSLNFIVNNLYRNIKRKISGLRIEIKGRLNASTIASKKIFQFGFLSLNTLDQKINSAHQVAFSNSFGVIGVKVYLLNKFIDKKDKIKNSYLVKSNLLKKLYFLKNEDKILMEEK